MSARLLAAALVLGLVTPARSDEDCPSCAPDPAPCAECIEQTAPPPIAPTRPLLRGPIDLLFRAELGGVYTHALERSFGGGRLGIEIGRDFEHMSFGGRFGLELGATESGLFYQRVSWGAGLDGKIGRVRLGLEPRLGFLSITRRSRPAVLDALLAPTLGVHLECIVALIGPERPSERRPGGLDLILRAGYDWIDVVNGAADASNTVAVQVGLGGRY